MIERNGCTMLEIISILNIRIETASARISELEDEGLIYVSSTYKNSTRSFWRYEPNVQKQKNNRLKRTKMKREAWYKKGMSNGWLYINAEDNICII